MTHLCNEADTIAAISTAVGPAGIGIVRMSGPEAIPLVGRAFHPARGFPVQPEETHCLLYGRVIDPDGGQFVDEALLAVMRKPRTYTREDVVEVHCHGGVAAQRAVLRLMLRLGARLADPGEFTRRAFLNGRIDLAQAESVAGIIAARSTGSLRSSLRQLDGGLSEQVKSLRRLLLGVLAQIEVSVDFPDEDVEEVNWKSALEGLDEAEAGLGRLMDTAFVGRVLEQGVQTAIVGKPNVGKSSLLNALLMKERAIVSDVPGTTRDTVEELVEIGGVPIHLVDTAGLRAETDSVERLGVARSRKAMAQADLVLMVVDLSRGVDEGERAVLADLDPARVVVVGNKLDLVPEGEDARDLMKEVRALIVNAAHREDVCSALRMCAVSALCGVGLEKLRGMIVDVVCGGREVSLEEPILAGERHRKLTGAALDAVRAARVSVQEERSEELVCEDLRVAIAALGEITGEEFTPDLLDEIFGRFCLGK